MKRGGAYEFKYFCHCLKLKLISEDAIIYGFLPFSFMAPSKHD